MGQDGGGSENEGDTCGPEEVGPANG